MAKAETIHRFIEHRRRMEAAVEKLLDATDQLIRAMDAISDDPEREEDDPGGPDDQDVELSWPETHGKGPVQTGRWNTPGATDDDENDDPGGGDINDEPHDGDFDDEPTLGSFDRLTNQESAYAAPHGADLWNPLDGKVDPTVARPRLTGAQRAAMREAQMKRCRPSNSAMARLHREARRA